MLLWRTCALSFIKVNKHQPEERKLPHIYLNAQDGKDEVTIATIIKKNKNHKIKTLQLHRTVTTTRAIKGKLETGKRKKV